MIDEWVSGARCKRDQARTGRKKRRFFGDSGHNMINSAQTVKVCVMDWFWTQVILKFWHFQRVKNMSFIVTAIFYGKSKTSDI